ncbi:MAG: alpha/beta hydrolase [Oscillospiraceae bacterium]
MLKNEFLANGIKLNYYEIKNKLPAIVFIHAQGTNALSFENTFKNLSKHFHIYTIDCPGHGFSDHNKKNYNIVSIGNAIIEFLSNVVCQPACVIGHSSGGLIAAYVAAYSQLCSCLILEDPPLFSSQGERRYKTFNYIDLSTICHNYIGEKIQQDFVLFYFENQKMWDFFPDKYRDKIKLKLINSAKKYRAKNPNKSLKVPFFPKIALSVYHGMNEYDPYFGCEFYDDNFNAGISHSDMLKLIQCKTLIMKAKTNFDNQEILLAAMNDDDVALANNLITNSKIVCFDCGHGIHIERKKEFIEAIFGFAK